MHNSMISKWTSICKYYAFDARKYSMEAFFGDLKTFKEHYEVNICNFFLLLLF